MSSPASPASARSAADWPCLGVRREDKNRWERRAPVAPSHVRELVKQGFRVRVQPSTLRTFADSMYAEAGAEIDEDLSACSAILAVKEVPIELLQENTTYVFFSHTIKAQAYNMPLLDSILERNIRLIDYEAIVDDKTGSRLVRFGKFAGFAGMVDTLHGMGDRFLAMRHSTPFLHIGMSYCYNSVDSAKQAVAAAGEEIASYGLPQEFTPMTFVFTSTGNVSRGAIEVFKQLPHEMLSPEAMVELAKHPERASRFKVYGTVLTAADFSERIDAAPGAPFDKNDYYANPEQYRCTFYEKYAPYVSVIMNCMYWDAKFPRLLTSKQVFKMVSQNRSRLLAVGDISCDPLGSIECLMKTTSIDNPTFIFDPMNGEVYDNEVDNEYMYRDGILFCAIDNFPTEFPKEATQYFGDSLLPFLPGLIKSVYTCPDSTPDPLPPQLERAVITINGKLTPKFEYIMQLRQKAEAQQRSILVIGAGYVSGPCVNYFLRSPKNTVTVCDFDVVAAQRLVEGKEKARAVRVNLRDADSSALATLIQQHSIVIALVPAPLIAGIAKICLAVGRPMVSASYTSDSMRELDAEAKRKGVLLLNEMGLDPGIDHLEALRMIDNIHERGGKVRSFVSWCGGLPLPEASGNPLAYKFSWAPRGVLTATANSAKYLQDNRLVEIPGQHLLEYVQPVNIFPGFSLEGYPNRDSTQYITMYNLKDEVRTFFRGTLRYSGYSEVIRAFREIGLISTEPLSWLPTTDKPLNSPPTWNEMLRRLLPDQAKTGVTTEHALHHRLEAHHRCFPSKGVSIEAIHHIIGCCRWLGLFEDTLVPTTSSGSPLDALCQVMMEKMQFDEFESDLIILHHMFEVEWPYKEEHETLTSTLVQRGRSKTNKQPRELAMAQTVGLPVAIAADLIMSGDLIPNEVTPSHEFTNRLDDSNVNVGEDGRRQFAGVMGPTFRELYVPLMDALEREGIRFVQKCGDDF